MQFATWSDTAKGLANQRDPVLVFVYGTLTDPDRVATLLEDSAGEYEFVGEATIEGLERVDGRYPTLVPGDSVDGRLLEVDDRALERLDRYEGVADGLYVRVSVPGPDDQPVAIYVGNPTRLGVDRESPWPDGATFAAAVRTGLERADVRLRRLE